MAVVGIMGSAAGGAAAGKLAGPMIAGSALGALGSLGSTYESSGESRDESSSWQSGYNNGITIGRTDTSSAERFNQAMMDRANEFSAEEAQKNRDWQERMSSTAFQRAVEDMKRAGINPILAAGTQASTPTGGVATGQMANIGASSWNYGRTSGESSGGSSSSGWSTSSAKGYNNLAEGVKSIAGKAGEIVGDVAKSGIQKITEGFGILRKNLNQSGKNTGKSLYENRKEYYGP